MSSWALPNFLYTASLSDGTRRVFFFFGGASCATACAALSLPAISLNGLASPNTASAKTAKLVARAKAITGRSCLMFVVSVIAQATPDV
jgi:hypothetical protein